MSLARLRLYAINTFIAIILAILLLDALPLTPFGLRMVLAPIVLRLGIQQGPWNLFAPLPVQTNTRLSAEITYRDGQRIKWVMPDPRQKSPWEKWRTHRERNFLVHLVTQEAAPAWGLWCRHLARTQRPDLPNADRGAEVRVIYEEAPIPQVTSFPERVWARWLRLINRQSMESAIDEKSWPTMREPTPFTISSVLTIEKLD